MRQGTPGDRPRRAAAARRTRRAHAPDAPALPAQSSTRRAGHRPRPAVGARRGAARPARRGGHRTRRRHPPDAPQDRRIPLRQDVLLLAQRGILHPRPHPGRPGHPGVDRPGREPGDRRAVRDREVAPGRGPWLVAAARAFTGAAVALSPVRAPPPNQLLPDLVTDGLCQARLRVYMNHAARPRWLPCDGGRARRVPGVTDTPTAGSGEDTHPSTRMSAVGNPIPALAAVSIRLARPRADVPYVPLARDLRPYSAQAERLR